MDYELDTKKIEILDKDFDHKIDSKKKIENSDKDFDPQNTIDSINKKPISLNNKLPELNTFNHSKYHYTNFINE